MDFIYRFRPVSRLLSEDGVSGELDSQYLYFADPEQLNDPLEGYKDIFFSGDSVVWVNFLSHYVRCLVHDCTLYILGGASKGPNKEIPVFISRESSPPGVNDLNDEVMNRLTAQKHIKEYLSVLAGGRQIRRPELIGHLSYLHPFVLSSILETFYERNLCASPPDLFGSQEDRIKHLERITGILSSMEGDVEHLDKLFEATNFLYSELQLVNRYRAEDLEGKEAWAYLLFEYAESYSRQIEKLIYREWYTACFMESCEDSSIWGTYGGNHKDVCLKFRVGNDREYPSLKLKWPVGAGAEGVITRWSNIEFHRVHYDRNFVEIDFFRSLGTLSYAQLNAWYRTRSGEVSCCASEVFEDEEAWRNKYWEGFYHAVTVKLKAWDREQEWRLLLSSPVNDLSKSELRKIQYDFESLDGVIFGINTPMESKFKIIKRVELLCRQYKRSSFNFYQARYDSGSKSIKYRLLQNLNVGFTVE